jgi:hypothetical protein
MTFRGFPPAQELDPVDAYFFAHPDEHRALFRWMETAAPSSFDHVVTTHTRGLPGDITHRSVFHVAGTRRETALYVISFDVTNAVTVTRVGEAGTSDGQIDARRIDVRRVSGFPGSTAAPEALSTWWQRRYPGAAGLLPGPPAGLTAAALIAAMNRKVAGGLVDRAWFERNYGIEVLDAVATAARLEGTHGVPRDLTGDTCDLDARDLCLLELSLETLSDAEVSLLRGIRVCRKTSSLSRDAQCYRTVGAALVGTTLTEWVGADRETTVLYFQLLYRNDAATVSVQPSMRGSWSTHSSRRPGTRRALPAQSSCPKPSRCTIPNASSSATITRGSTPGSTMSRRRAAHLWQRPGERSRRSQQSGDVLRCGGASLYEVADDLVVSGPELFLGTHQEHAAAPDHGHAV